MNTTTESISFIIDEATFIDSNDNSTELGLEFYLKNIIDVTFKK